ncbi:DEAD/DEAH box helicase [Robertmurraya siralis]|uniref:DEAD/DEAH box helicase n=1 Tax=Robertmurraya siralis TaxID=77777 RepID=UPI0010F70F57|nr:DEAD/DEAH box helicase [Robertmurraya siralis]
MQSFSALGISQKLVDKMSDNGIVVPTPIQEQAIPSIIDKRDVIAQAQTGTGKTFAFLLPMIDNIEPNSLHIQALIVAPTRELALQITEEAKKLVENLDGIDVLSVYGGQDVEKQLKKLQHHVQIIVGTPGRVLDHIRRKTLTLSKVSYLVLDEADQMLHIGFLDEVEEIINETPKTRQTLLFSATIPEEIRKLSEKHMCRPLFIQVEKVQGPATTVKQIAIHTVDRAKQGTLIKLLEMHRPFLAVVFCRTKRRVSKLAGVLKAQGISCDELHGDLSQPKREQVMKRFREAEIQVLVATDVAARGLDVEGVTHVFNYDIPQDSESYVHRIGRTGRAGMKGMAITLYSSADRVALDLIESELNIRIPKQNIGNTEQKKQKGRESTNETKTKGEVGKEGKNFRRSQTASKKKERAKQERNRQTSSGADNQKKKLKKGGGQSENKKQHSYPKKKKSNSVGKRKSYRGDPK